MNSEMRAAIITRIAIKRGDISAKVYHFSCSESFTFTYSVFLKVFPSSSLNSITIGMLTSPFSVFSVVVEEMLEEVLEKMRTSSSKLLKSSGSVSYTHLTLPTTERV